MKKLLFIIVCLLITVPCSADTFIHRGTGEVFQGYATQEKKGSKTLVRIGDKQVSKYIDLVDYDIEWNPSGRRNQIIVLPIKSEIELECETKAFEKAIRSASNQGPLLVLIEIDTPGGRGELMKRICDAIISTDNCRTVAFVSGGKYGGAYSAGAIIAIACDYIYMADGTAIGAAAPIVISSSGVKDVKSAFGKAAGEKFVSADRGYIAALAEQNGRSGLIAKAMVDSDIEVLEVVEDGNTIFIASKDKKGSQTVKKVLNERGKLLTLTAAEAVQYGIANKILNSMEGIVSEFGFEKPRIIYNQDVINVKREYENTKVKVKTIYDDIDLLQKDISVKLSKFQEVDRQYNKAVDILNYYKSSRWYDERSQRKKVEELSSERSILKSALLRALRDLKLKYTALISLNNVYPDLHIDTERVNKEINTVDVMIGNIK
jgi:ATP-dependent protease ClpP protease subunit